MDKFIITFMDIRNGNPADEDNQVTNFFTVRQMCAELMQSHDVIERGAVINSVRRVAKSEGVTLTDGYPPTLNCAWGEWQEVGTVKRNPNMRMFVVKVVDTEITEIDRNWRAGRGGS
jgi:hypothetical protein